MDFQAQQTNPWVKPQPVVDEVGLGAQLTAIERLRRSSVGQFGGEAVFWALALPVFDRSASLQHLAAAAL